MLKLEVGEDASISCCDCCGAESATGHGFIYKDGLAHAVYFVGWSAGHPERGVTMAIAIGRWDDVSTADDRTCFGLEAHASDGQVIFSFIDPDDSPWANTELLGPMISQMAARAEGARGGVLSIGEHVVRSHPAVRTFLDASV